jgi:hypothetical protein
MGFRDAIKNCTMKYLARQSDEWFAYLFGKQFSRPEGYLRWDQEEMKQKLGINPAPLGIEDQNPLDTDNSVPVGAEGEGNQDTTTAATGQAQKHTNAAVTVPANSSQQNDQQNKDESGGNKHQSKASITINIQEMANFETFSIRHEFRLQSNYCTCMKIMCFSDFSQSVVHGFLWLYSFSVESIPILSHTHEPLHR